MKIMNLLNFYEVLQSLSYAHKFAVVYCVGDIGQNHFFFVCGANIKVLKVTNNENIHSD